MESIQLSKPILFSPPGQYQYIFLVA